MSYAYRGKKAGLMAAMLAMQANSYPLASHVIVDEFSRLWPEPAPFNLKPFTLQLYLHTGIGAATFGAIRPAHPDTLRQVGLAIERLPAQVAPMRWVTSWADKEDRITA